MKTLSKPLFSATGPLVATVDDQDGTVFVGIGDATTREGFAVIVDGGLQYARELAAAINAIGDLHRAPIVRRAA
jgi:hypothetical protein